MTFFTTFDAVHLPAGPQEKSGSLTYDIVSDVVELWCRCNLPAKFWRLVRCTNIALVQDSSNWPLNWDDRIKDCPFYSRQDFFSSLFQNFLFLKSESSQNVQHDVRVNFFLSSIAIGWQDVNFSLGSLVGFFRKVIFLSPYSPPPPAKLKNLSFWSSCHRARYNMGRGPGVDLRGFLFSELSKGKTLGKLSKTF